MNVLRLIICLSIAFGFSSVASAQKGLVKDADLEFRNEAYYRAADLYKKAFPKTPKPADKARIIYKIAECYRLMTNAKQAQVWYTKAIKSKYDDPLVHFYLGQVLKEQGKYPEAIKAYKEYNAKSPGNKRGEDAVKACELAQKWKDKPTRHEVNPEVLLNSRQYDFSPAFSDKRNKTLIFTSSRQGAMGARVDERTGENFQDLFTSTRDKKGKWSEPTLLQGEFIGSEHHEGFAAFNKKRSVMYFTRCRNVKNQNLGCNIWYASRVGQGFGKAVKMELKPEGDGADTMSVGHPAISPDDNFLIFASDMPGGYGGKDLWMTRFNKKTKAWSKPENLGAGINTSQNEMFPFVHQDGNLYFSSDGHVGMGGLDMFKAPKTGEMQWGEVENLQSPLNSEADDYGITFDGVEDRGYFTSNRDGGKGKDDIWSFRLPPVLFTLQCVVYDKDTRKPVVGARVKVAGTDNSSFEVTTDANGGFNLESNGETRYINPNTTYAIQVDQEDYLVAKDKISTVGKDESTTFIKEFYIQYAAEEVVIRLPEVRYAYNLADLQIIPGEVNSQDSLNVLFQTLVENPTIRVELHSHTDHRGKADYNRKLSQARAQSCVDYLISRGIPIERMSAKGYGEDKPRTGLAPEDIAQMKTKEEQEAAHQKNRRTEFIVTGFDFQPENTWGVAAGFEKKADDFLNAGGKFSDEIKPENDNTTGE